MNIILLSALILLLVSYAFGSDCQWERCSSLDKKGKPVDCLPKESGKHEDLVKILEQTERGLVRYDCKPEGEIDAKKNPQDNVFQNQ